MHLAQIMLSQSCAKTAINSELSIKIDQKLAKTAWKVKLFERKDDLHGGIIGQSKSILASWPEKKP